MSVSSAASSGRRAAEARMLSTVVVRRKTGDMTTGPDGFEVPEWATVFTGAFRLGGSDGAAGSRKLDVGGVEVQVATRVGHFPATADDLSDGDLIDVTAGENAGLVLRVVEGDWQDQSTARRVPVVATTRPEEWS